MGSAQIGDSSACLIAIRVNRMLSQPAESHAIAKLDHELNAFLEAADRLAARLSDAFGTRVPSIVQLESGSYLLWILPLAPAPASPVLEIQEATPKKTEAELRGAVIDRLIAARLNESKPGGDATLEQWHVIGAQNTAPAGSPPKAG
jgi:hypothetical protein